MVCRRGCYFSGGVNLRITRMHRPMAVWFGRRARGLVRTLKPKHQLDQIVLAQPLQIIAIHPNLESATRPIRKGL
jgi:hypothetical protein